MTNRVSKRKVDWANLPVQLLKAKSVILVKIIAHEQKINNHKYLNERMKNYKAIECCAQLGNLYAQKEMINKCLNLKSIYK